MQHFKTQIGVSQRAGSNGKRYEDGKARGDGRGARAEWSNVVCVCVQAHNIIATALKLTRSGFTLLRFLCGIT